MRRWEAGVLWTDSRTGQQSPAHDDYKRPVAWVVTPPPGRALQPRRFDNASTIPAVRWAWEQAMAPEPPAAVGGVLALAALMASAARSGVVAEGGDKPSSPVLPDAELLSLCREIAGADRIADGVRNDDVCPWERPAAFEVTSDKISEAVRDKERLIPCVIELEATTPAGVLAKLQVVAGLFDSSQARRAAAVRAVAADLARVMRQPRPES